MGHSGNITDTNTVAETCDNKFEFDVATVSFAPDISHLPLSENIDYSSDSTDKEPIQLKVKTPGNCNSRPLFLAEFIDIFYKNNKIGNCSDICYSLIDITNSTKRLLIPVLCDSEKLSELVKENNGEIWCDITLKSFGRSPWWQSVELSTAMATAIAELNCRHNIFCKKIGNIMRMGTEDGNEFRCSLPNWDDVDRGVLGTGDSNKIPNLGDLVEYYDAWCGVLVVARHLGYIPKCPKNKVKITNICHPVPYENQCCNKQNLFKSELWDLVPELCENIKNIKSLEKEGIDCNKYTFLYWNQDAPNEKESDSDNGGFTTRINCGDGDLETMVTSNGPSNNESRVANPIGYSEVSSLLKIIQMGLLDWDGCLAARDDENPNKEEEIKEDLENWKKWFVDLQGEEICGYDFDSSHIVPKNPIADPKRKNTMSIAFLLKLATMKFASNDEFKQLLCPNNFKNSDETCYDYSQTLSEYFNPISNDKSKLVNNCKYYNPCKRMTVKKNIIKSNKNLKHSILRLCGCSLTKDELLTTISDYIIRDMDSPGSVISKIINAKFNINYCREGNGIENVVMYDININIDLGIYVTLASTCKDKESIEKVIKYLFNNPNDDILASVAESLLVELQSSHPSCYPSGFSQTQVSEYGVQIYENVLASGVGGGSGFQWSKSGRNAPNLSKTLLTSNKFIECFKTKQSCLSKHKNRQSECLNCN